LVIWLPVVMVASRSRGGLDWTHKYPSIAEGLRALDLGSTYLDGELCALNEDGTTSFSGMQAATDTVGAAELVYFVFDLLFVDGASIAELPLIERKARLDLLLAGAAGAIRYSDHAVGDGPRFAPPPARREPRASSRSAPMHRTSPATAGCGARRSALTARSSLWSAGRTRRGRGPISGRCCWLLRRRRQIDLRGPPAAACRRRSSKKLREALTPLAMAKMPLAAPPPKTNRFGAPLKLSRLHWVRPELVAEVTFLTWTADGLLRQVTYQGLREDKAAREVRRPVPS
jgi:bifunctional non-homologous end joining protein LigD